MELKNQIIELANYFLPIVGLLFLGLILWNLYLFGKESKWKWHDQQRMEHLKTFFVNLKTPAFGMLLILCSFALSATFLGAATSSTLTNLPEYTGVLGVFLFILSGTFYILTGFAPWLKIAARAFLILAPTYLIFQILYAAFLAN